MDTVDQRYRYSPRDFVTTSTRADTVESLAGQETEILSVGPQPESATVTDHHRMRPTWVKKNP